MLYDPKIVMTTPSPIPAPVLKQIPIQDTSSLSKDTSSLPEDSHSEEGVHEDTVPHSPHVKPIRKPVLRFEIRDLSLPGVSHFLRHVDVSRALEHAVQKTLDLLYVGQKPEHIPGTRSVTLVLHAFDGVAYTTGTDLDDDHKEIHFSTGYIRAIQERAPKRFVDEMNGVIVHEMVHCFQWSASGVPGGLIEGVADWVRLQAGLAPPHWKRAWKECTWDAGYERTGYFLEWVEGKCGVGTVRKLNMALRGGYEEAEYWKSCCKRSVGHLWKEYGEEMEKRVGGEECEDKNLVEEGQSRTVDIGGEAEAIKPQLE